MVTDKKRNIPGPGRRRSSRDTLWFRRAQAYAEESVAPVAHELVARIDRGVQLSHALPTIKFEANKHPNTKKARGAERAGERLASQLLVIS